MLPRGDVDVTSMKMFKATLRGALSNLIELKMSQLIAEGWTR